MENRGYRHRVRSQCGAKSFRYRITNGVRNLKDMVPKVDLGLCKNYIFTSDMILLFPQIAITVQYQHAAGVRYMTYFIVWHVKHSHIFMKSRGTKAEWAAFNQCLYHRFQMGFDML